jgi:hypothetical protein
MNRFKLSEISKFHKTRRRVLPDLAIEGDSLMSIAYGYVVLDMVKLDDELRRLYPDEYEYSSIMEIVRNHYGDAGVELLEALL